MLPVCFFCPQSAVSHLKKITERGPWTQDMREAHNRVVAGDYGGALLLYSRLAEVPLYIDAFPLIFFASVVCILGRLALRVTGQDKRFRCNAYQLCCV